MWERWASASAAALEGGRLARSILVLYVVADLRINDGGAWCFCKLTNGFVRYLGDPNIIPAVMATVRSIHWGM